MLKEILSLFKQFLHLENVIRIQINILNILSESFTVAHTYVYVLSIDNKKERKTCFSEKQCSAVLSFFPSNSLQLNIDIEHPYAL